MAEQGAEKVPAARIEALSPAKRALLDSLARRRKSATSGDPTASAGGPVRLRSGAADSGEPIVLVHPIGGGVFCYAELSGLIPGDREVIGLAADRFLRQAAPPSVEELADHYLGLLRDRGVDRPAVLAGWSFGGVVAYEMARRHTTPAGAPAQDGGVPVVLIDSAPWPRQTGAWSRATMLEMFVEDLLGSGGMTVDRVPVEPAVWQLPVPDALAAAARQLTARGLELGLPQADMTDRYTAFTHATAAMQRHRPRPRSGPLTLLHAEHSQAHPETWTALARDIAPTVLRVPGDHFSVLRPPTVHRVAEALGQAAGVPDSPAPRSPAPASGPATTPPQHRSTR
ncbi:thioesterase domain-containing protein [Streptomyces sp. SLBN-115]|uniref:thioesterase domain-containing protein n=1 Tax=Streptomyces sp. SLBN-115 TaxID=2768453 RepID=UPI001150D8F2|nr:thioesterase domain-containing protein [Streptomyces sp. SLBN-115]TQJ52602.1 thioesterase domain-containing protein [Streptomyces sp. SLBN-115]